jgi:hypothetical protein
MLACRSGADTFVYRVTDKDGRVGSSTVTINVTPGAPSLPVELILIVVYLVGNDLVAL